MKKETITVEINKVQLHVSLAGIEPVEAAIIAGQVEERIKQIEQESDDVNTLKFALLAAMSFAAELYTLKNEFDGSKQLQSKHVDEMIYKLQGALHKPLR